MNAGIWHTVIENRRNARYVGEAAWITHSHGRSKPCPITTEPTSHFFNRLQSFRSKWPPALLMTFATPSADDSFPKNPLGFEKSLFTSFTIHCTFKLVISPSNMLNLLASFEDPTVGISNSYRSLQLRSAITSTILFATVLAAIGVCYSEGSYVLVSIWTTQQLCKTYERNRIVWIIA